MSNTSNKSSNLDKVFEAAFKTGSSPEAAAEFVSSGVAVFLARVAEERSNCSDSSEAICKAAASIRDEFNEPIALAIVEAAACALKLAAVTEGES